MSFPKVEPKQYLKCRSNRMASQFAKRLATRGTLIDRTQTRNPKDPKSVKAPDALTRFFNPIKEAL